MALERAGSFGELLRRYRLQAALTQEELAERARMSAHAISQLERGARRAPRKDTVDLVVEALALTGPDRAAFEAAARQRWPADQTMVGDVSRVDIVLPAPARVSEDGGAPNSERQQSRMWGIPSSRIKSLSALYTGRARTGGMVGMLIVVVLGSTLLLRGDLGASGQAGSCGGTLALATDFPTSGIDGSAQGANDKSMENAANLAIVQHQNLGSGYTLKALNYDDSLAGAGVWEGIHDPATGARNVRQLVKNPCIVGMVGPMHSDVAAAEMPIAANAGLAMISPGSTSPSLTLRPFAEAEGQTIPGYYGDQYSGSLPGVNFDQLHPPGKPINYFRVVPNDAVQVVVDAQVTYILGAKSVYVVNDAIPYGELLAGGFTQAFEGRGGRVIGIATLGPDAQDVLDVAARIAAANPDAVFYGGGGLTSSGGGLLKARLVNLGYRGFFVGSEGITSNPDFVTQAGNAADGTFASVGALDPSTFTSGAATQFLSDYSARYPRQNPPFYAAYAYDATMVLITAIKHLITARQAVTRTAVIEQVQHIQYAGVTGPISFDSNGDISHGIVSIYVAHRGQWTYAWQLSA